MASLSDVSRYLRQRRAIGKPITAKDRAAAWEAYFSSQADKDYQRKHLSLQQQSINNQQNQFNQSLALTREKMDNEAEAATISGVTDLALTGATLYESDLGQAAISKVGDFFTGTEAAGEAASAAGGAQGTTQALTTGKTVAGAGATGSTAAVGSYGTATSDIGSAFAAESAPALTSYVAPAAAGAAAGGWAGKQTQKSETMQGIIEDATFGILHAKKDAAKVTGAAAGAAAGAAMGSVVPGVGTAIGAVIGGIFGAVTGGK